MAHALPRTQQSVADLAEDAIVWASQHGLIMGAGWNEVAAATVHAPLSLFPCSFPRARFEEVCDVMPLFNTLVDRISRDESYLTATLQRAAAFDDFTAQLLNMHSRLKPIRDRLATREVVLGIHRSDYMLDEPTNTLLQVELNTIASSFGCLSTITSQLHAYILQRAASSDMDVKNLPHNQTREEIADAIACAHAAYGDDSALPIMIVQPGERNAFDQQWISTALWQRHGIRMLRRTLHDIATQASLHDDSLWIDDRKVSVVYLRAGYGPSDYPTDVEWRGREMIETSDAAKCPSLQYQLAGSKKVQQDLARPGVLERFMDSDGDAAALRRTFAGLWGLGDEGGVDDESRDAVSRALRDPDAFVLKPQREGGGNNIYGQDVAKVLREGKGLAAYILMQRIQPPVNRAVLLRNGNWLEADVLSELGIFGTFVRHGDKQLLNTQAGHLIRTKAASSNEGGVAAGFAVLDSPYLQ